MGGVPVPPCGAPAALRPPPPSCGAALRPAVERCWLVGRGPGVGGGDGGGRQRRGRLRLRLQLLAALSAQPHAAPPFPPPSNPKFCFTCTFPFILFYFFYPPPLLPTPPTTPPLPPRAASQPPLPPLPHPSLFLPSSSHRSAPGGAGDDVTTRGATTNPSVPPAGGSWTAIKPSLQKHSDASSVREMLRAASPPPNLGMGEVGGVSLHWVNELPFSSPIMASKIWKGQRRKLSRGARKRKDRRKKREPPGPRTHPGGGGKGGWLQPPCPHAGAPTSHSSRAAAGGRHVRPRRGNTGHCWDCSPGRGPLPFPITPPPPSNAISTADPIRVHRLRDRPHRTAPRSSAQHQRSDAPHVPLPPLPASRRADVPRPHPRQPRGGGRLNGPGGS